MAAETTLFGRNRGRSTTVSDLLKQMHGKNANRRSVMSKTRVRWLLAGAIAVGIAVAVYLLLLCPAECH